MKVYGKLEIQDSIYISDTKAVNIEVENLINKLIEYKEANPEAKTISLQDFINLLIGPE